MPWGIPVEVIKKETDDRVKDFLVATLDEVNRYFLQVESTMHDLLKFYTTLLLGLVTASVTLLQLFRPSPAAPATQSGQVLPLPIGIAAIWMTFFILGLLELYYYLELRIRKIRLVEQIAAIRTYFSSLDEAVYSLIRLVRSVKESPPYLRRPCAEWYAVIYVSLINASALLIVVSGARAHVLGLLGMVTPQLRQMSHADYVRWILPVAGIVAFLLQFIAATSYAYYYDLKREREVGPSNYKVFVHGRVPFPFRSLNYVARQVEAVQRRRMREPRADESIRN